MTCGRILLVVLMLWGLAMIVPDLVHVLQPLGSFGFYADNDGVIYDVTGPFESRRTRLRGSRASALAINSTFREWLALSAISMPAARRSR
jgi:hypothetical protein